MIRLFALKRLHIYVLLSLAVFLVVQISKYYAIAGPAWVFHYLNDFLAIPIIATIGLHGVWLIKQDKTLRLNGFTILSLVVLYSVVFEYYLPQQDERYTGDIWDVVCYGLGGLVFYVLQKME